MPDPEPTLTQQPPAPTPQRRGGPPVLAIAALILLFGVAGGVGAYFLVVKPGHDDAPAVSGNASPPAVPSDRPGTAGQGSRAETQSQPDHGGGSYHLAQPDGFSMEVPAGWRLTDDAVDESYGIRNTWSGPDHASVLVDFTRGFKGTSDSAARELRANGSKASGYREVSFGPVTLGDNEMVEWRFIKDGEEKVDYFTDACGTGYAVLGAAPEEVFGQYEADFRHAAETLDPEC